MSPLPSLWVLLLELHVAGFWQLCCHHSVSLLNAVVWCNIMELVMTRVPPPQPPPPRQQSKIIL